MNLCGLLRRQISFAATKIFTKILQYTRSDLSLRRVASPCCCKLSPSEYRTLQLKYTVSMPEKISICLNRGREESVGNDDVSIVCTSKLEMVRMTSRQKIPKGGLGLCHFYLLLTNGTSFHTPCLELCIPLNCCKCTVFIKL